MKLKNEALQKLYDTIVKEPIFISPYGSSPIDKAFKDCDEKLSESVTFEQLKNLQDRNGILEKSNGTLLDANLDLCTKNRDLKDRISILEKELDEAKSSVNYFKASRNDLRSRAGYEEEGRVEQEKRADILAEQINKLLGERIQLQKEVEQLKKDLDALLSRTHCAEDEVEQLKKDKERFKQTSFEWAKRAVERGKKLNEAEAVNRELKKDRDIWVRNNGEKQAQMAELKKKLEAREEELDELKRQLDGALEAKKAVNDSRYKWAQKWLSTKQNLEAKLNEAEVKYRRLEKEHKKLASEYQMITIENKRLQDGLRDIGYEQGQTDLWDKLQNVNDTQPNEFDVECESMYDVIGMDLEDFLDAYKKWQDQKETDRMRDYLERFCMGKLCISCPLHSYDFKCGRGSWFSDMSAEDIKRHYEKAVGHGRYTLNDGKLFATPSMEGVNKAITEACENFCKTVRDADIKIKENIPRNALECTLEAKVEVDKDLLNEVCGIVPVEEEHKLEYGDAVRLPWRDYDYMYIGPEEKHIRLFNPMTHTVVFVSPTEKLTYQGCKIVICDEDDLRKIWKDKK